MTDERDEGMQAYIDQLPAPETLVEAIAQRDAWVESACQFSRNEDYYRGLLDRIGNALGPDAFTADAGSISESVLRAKLPELVEALVAQRLSQ